jgi:hypothetical protein
MALMLPAGTRDTGRGTTRIPGGATVLCRELLLVQGPVPGSVVRAAVPARAASGSFPAADAAPAGGRAGAVPRRGSAGPAACLLGSPIGCFPFTGGT